MSSVTLKAIVTTWG